MLGFINIFEFKNKEDLYHKEYSNYCLHLSCYIHVSADVSLVVNNISQVDGNISYIRTEYFPVGHKVEWIRRLFGNYFWLK